MTTRIISNTRKPARLTITRWLWIGIRAALGSILAVLLAQAAILALWPELVAFKPLESYARSALFTLILAIVATAIFACLVKNQEHPEARFLWIAAGFLLLSFIPDYLLPVPYRTLLASTTAAFLHLIAGIVTVTLILTGYRRSISLGK